MCTWNNSFVGEIMGQQSFKDQFVSGYKSVFSPELHFDRSSHGFFRGSQLGQRDKELGKNDANAAHLEYMANGEYMFFTDEEKAKRRT